MASVEGLVVSKIIEQNDLTPVLDLGLRPMHFAGDWEEIYQWVFDHHNNHGAVPTMRAFKTAWGSTTLPDADTESFSGLAQELVSAYKHRVVTDTLADVTKNLDPQSIDDVIHKIHEGIAKAEVDTSKIKSIDVVSTWEDRFKAYEELRANPAGIRGIPTGFVALDAITGGYQAGQFIILGGEEKRGKSYFTLIMAMAAHAAGYKVLFMSFEMSNFEQAARYDALTASINYQHLLSGELNADEMARLKGKLKRDQYGAPIIFAEDAARLTTIGAVRAQIEEHKPDITFIDGMYLMDDELGEQKGSPQALKNITQGAKKLGQLNNTVIFGTTQVLGRRLHNQSKREVTADAFGGSSSWGQDADIALGVERDPEIDNRSIIRLVAGRNQGANQTVNVQWDWSNTSYEEVFFGKRKDDDHRQASYNP